MPSAPSPRSRLPRRQDHGLCVEEEPAPKRVPTTSFPAPSSSMCSTDTPYSQATPASMTACSSCAAYSGPVSSAFMRCRPKPLCTHCLSTPPGRFSRSTIATRAAPARRALTAAAMPAAPPPMTTTSKLSSIRARPPGSACREPLPHAAHASPSAAHPPRQRPARNGGLARAHQLDIVGAS